MLKAARQSATVVMATAPREQQSATLLHLLTMLTQKGARKVVRKAGNNGFEACRQFCPMFGTSEQEGSTGLFVQIMKNKFGSKIEDVEDRLNELVRRYDGAKGTDPVPEQVKKGVHYSAERSSRRSQLETHAKTVRWKSMPLPERERQGKTQQEQEGWQETATLAKGFGETRVSVEIAESTDTKLLTVGASSSTTLKAKARVRRSPKSQKSVK